MVIILTGHEDIELTIDALRLKADDYLIKPCSTEELLFRVKQSLEKLELKRKIKVYEEILPVCSVCKKIRDDAGKESGTGEWKPMESYIHEKAGLMVSHSFCPECAEAYYKEFKDEI